MCYGYTARYTARYTGARALPTSAPELPTVTRWRVTFQESVFRCMDKNVNIHSKDREYKIKQLITRLN